MRGPVKVGCPRSRGFETWVAVVLPGAPLIPSLGMSGDPPLERNELQERSDFYGAQ